MFQPMNNQEKNSYVRRQILHALLDMMREQAFDSIPVSALTERAGVGRASFYRNFASKEDVLRQEAERLTREWTAEWQQHEPAAPNEFLISLLNFYKLHAAFYLLLYQAGHAEIVLDTILKSAEIAPELPNAVAYLKSAMAYMIYGWIIEWMRRGMQESGTELAQMIDAARAKNSAGGS